MKNLKIIIIVLVYLMSFGLDTIHAQLNACEGTILQQIFQLTVQGTEANLHTRVAGQNLLGLVTVNFNVTSTTKF